MEQYLRCYVNYQQDNWVELLPLAQMAFNNSAGPAGISLFYANYGYHPRMDRDSKEGRLIAEEARVSVEKIIKLYKILKGKLNKILKKELNRILKKTIITVNKKRFKRLDFKEGEIIYINIKNIKI